MNMPYYFSIRRLGFFYIMVVILIMSPFNGFAQKKASSNRIGKDTVSDSQSKSGYNVLVVDGGQNTTDADLKNDDASRGAWLGKGYSKSIFAPYYKQKQSLIDKAGIAIGMDYMFLNQYASFSFSDQQAASGIFRVFATWGVFRKTPNVQGSLTVKIENRHIIGSGLVPRNLGYEAGGALSTASFKDFKWGLSNFYWKQKFYKDDGKKDKFALVFGIMDPGDWIDLYPLLNPFKYYLNEAFFNNPGMALPNQGFGVALLYNFYSNFYVSGGIHDANGEPTKFIIDNVNSFFNQREYFTWIEMGFNSTNRYTNGETIHITYWHQDARADPETEESTGWCFSASKVFSNGFKPFVRLAISEGDGARMRHMIITGAAFKAFKHDVYGVGINWGGPSDRSKRDQYSFEAFYAFQLTENLNIMPDIQFTINPSFNDEKDLIGVFSVVRLRYAL